MTQPSSALHRPPSTLSHLLHRLLCHLFSFLHFVNVLFYNSVGFTSTFMSSFHCQRVSELHPSGTVFTLSINQRDLNYWTAAWWVMALLLVSYGLSCQQIRLFMLDPGGRSRWSANVQGRTTPVLQDPWYPLVQRCYTSLSVFKVQFNTKLILLFTAQQSNICCRVLTWLICSFYRRLAADSDAVCGRFPFSVWPMLTQCHIIHSECAHSVCYLGNKTLTHSH